MAHTVKNKENILKRINRIKGQLDAVANLIESEEDCYKVMQVLSSSRGALNGLMGDLVEDHIEEHIVRADSKQKSNLAGQQLTQILKSFWK